MNRNTRTMIVLTIAIVVAGLASLGVYRAIQQMPVRQVEVRSLYQVVAAADMAMGTLVTKEQVKLVAWPASSPVSKGFTTIESVVNRGLIDSVAANEPLTETKLATIEAGAGLPPSITEGMRAVSVRVNEVIGVAGFVVPGTHVDVMVTLKRAESKDTLTRVVVSDVEVLTAGTRYDQGKSRDGQPIPTSVVTLLVTPPDAERVALAASEGEIMLTLRNPMDRKPTESAGVRTGALFGQTPEKAPTAIYRPRQAVIEPVAARVVEPPPVTKVYSVETIRGAKRSEEVVR